MVARAGRQTAPAKPWMVAISIASESRPLYWQRQNATWGHELVGEHFVPVSEPNVAPCTQCTHKMDNRLRAMKEGKYTHGYQCAQQRPIQAIGHALQRYPRAGWFLVVDDDTWVDSLSVREMVLRIDRWPASRRPAAIGSVYANDAEKYVANLTRKLRSLSMVLGGAGYLLHGPIARKLLHQKRRSQVVWKAVTPLPTAAPPDETVRVIDECVHNTLGGPWCYWNSDWIVSECLAMVGIRPVHHSGFTQWGKQCRPRSSITCHPIDQQRQITLSSARRALHVTHPHNQARHSAQVNNTHLEYHHSFRWEYVRALTAACKGLDCQVASEW